MIAKTVLSALGIGAFTGLASSTIQKAVGNGLYLKKGSCVCQVETNENEVYLGHNSGAGFESVGDDLYLEKGGKLYNGKGLVLGPNSPLKKSPIFGLIL